MWKYIKKVYTENPPPPKPQTNIQNKFSNCFSETLSMIYKSLHGRAVLLDYHGIHLKDKFATAVENKQVLQEYCCISSYLKKADDYKDNIQDQKTGPKDHP